MNKKIALVSGASGQTASYMIEKLLKEDFFVVGLKRRSSLICTDRIDHLYGQPNFVLRYFDLDDPTSIYSLLKEYQPDVFFNFAAQSHVKVSFEVAQNTVDVVGIGVLRILDAIRLVSPHTKYFQASSSEMFGGNKEIPFNEESRFVPNSPYAAAKCFTARTKIYTECGLKSISNIKKGEMVWTHTGQLKKVVEVLKRKYHGELINVIVNNGSVKGTENKFFPQSNIQFTCTPEHPIMTKRGWILAGDLLEDDKIMIVSSRCVNCDKKIPGNRIYCSNACKTKYAWDYDDKYREKQIKFTRERFKKYNPLKSKESVEKKQKSFGEYLLKKGKNYMEYYVDLLLMDSCPGFFKFVGDGKLCIDGYFPDWINEEKKAIVEFVGWGEGFERREKQLKKKIDYLSSIGYKIHLIKGKDFNNPQKIKEEVSKFVSDLGSLEFVYNPITKIKKYNTNKPIVVYNLEVEDDHTFIANGVISHNCLAHDLVRIYRESYGLYACSGIMFNNESSRRGSTFVTRKITLGAASIKLGLEDNIKLGNLFAKRDWTYSGDTVEAIYLMMQQEKPNDYVISSDESHTVEEFLNVVFDYSGLGDYKKYVIIDKKYFRPLEVDYLLGDSSKIRKLGWFPKVSFENLAKMMYDSDYKIMELKIKEGKNKWRI